ncbi:MAG: PEPxxWA-CTERM sorting domain-containing protein [Polymorphobacter sp.]|uniref:Npun_F0296 family exosortase-dependent surface protein n=1 Tax=Polymorphobacter sp. TaxID=1909290 RepID=UPI003A861E27
MTLSARILLAATALASAGPAAAVVAVVGSVAGAPDPGISHAGFVEVITFDAPSAAGIVNTTSGAVITAAGNISRVRAAPAGTAPGGIYQSVGTGGSSTFDFAGYLPQFRVLTGLSLYWGSVDSHNALEFLNADGSVVSAFTGSDLPRFDGNQTLGATNRRITFAMAGQNEITQVRFRGQGNAFEFDTIGAAVGSVPEPASWAMLIAGFGLVGGAMRRRRKMALA